MLIVHRIREVDSHGLDQEVGTREEVGNQLHW